MIVHNDIKHYFEDVLAELKPDRSMRDTLIRRTELRFESLQDLRIIVEADSLRLKRIREMLEAKQGFEEPCSPQDANAQLMQTVAKRLEDNLIVYQFEINMLECAFDWISQEAYFMTVHGRYVLKKSDEWIAENIHCDVSTVKRNRKKLLKKLATLLYGEEAMK